jgi:acyl carrier protein
MRLHKKSEPWFIARFRTESWLLFKLEMKSGVNMANAKEKVNAVLAELSFINDIKPNQTIRCDLGLDSLKMAEMLCALEDVFGVELKTDDLNPESLNNVADLYSLMEKYKNE